MINWLLSLTIEQQVAFSIALASTLVLLVQIVLVFINFYGVDRLNVESDNLEQYEIVANCDSDMSQNKPKFISIVAINIFLLVSCWTYFALNYTLPKLAQILLSLVLGAVVSIIFSICKKLIKKNILKRKANANKQ